MQEIQITSSMDRSSQPCRVYAVNSPGLCPLLVALHTWGADYKLISQNILQQADARGWHCIVPNFRGPNRTPQACGSALAQRDVLDAVDWACEHLPVDRQRIYLVGGSGGGHMTLRMAAAAPHRFAAASAWCGITDLAAWHAHHSQTDPPGRYALDIEACVGGKPGDSAQIDADLRVRSPLHFIANAWHLPIDFSAGVHDGKTGSVPFRHTIDAFNQIARAHAAAPVTEAEIQQLWEQGRLDCPSQQDTAPQAAYGRAIHLQRWAGPSRLTIFEGGHELLPEAACHWLAQHTRAGRSQAHPVSPLTPRANDATLTG